MSIESLATDPATEPLWPGILRGVLEGPPSAVAAFAEACSMHGLDGEEMGAIVEKLREAARLLWPGVPLEIECGDDVVLAWQGHGYSAERLRWWWSSYSGVPAEPAEVWLLEDKDVGGFARWQWRVSPGTEGAKPWTIIGDHEWPLEDDWKTLREEMEP